MIARTRAFAALLAVVAATNACSGEARPPSTAPPRSGSVWVAVEGQDSLAVIDAATNAVAATLNGIKGPHNVQVGRDGAVVYAVSSADVVVAIDPATYRVTAAAPTGSRPAHIIEAPDGSYAYTGVSEPPSVVKVDLAQRKVVGSTAVPDSPVQLYLTPDETAVVSADQSDDAARGHTVSVIDTATMTPDGIVTVGAGPHGVVLDASGKWAWVTNSYDDTVVGIDLSDLSVLDAIRVGAQPSGISYSPRAPAETATGAVTLEVPPSLILRQGADVAPHGGHRN